MGLDIVELFMAVEEEFAVSIPEDDAAELLTAGELFDYLKAKCEHRSDWSDAGAWSALQRIVVEQLDVNREDVTREARFIQDLGAG